MNCLEKNVQPELPQNFDEKELLGKFDQCLRVADKTDMPIYNKTEHEVVSFLDVHQQITTKEKLTTNLPVQLDFYLTFPYPGFVIILYLQQKRELEEQQIKPQMHPSPIIASSPPFAHSMLYSPQSPMMNVIHIFSKNLTDPGIYLSVLN
jgi:hypothetical protein